MTTSEPEVGLGPFGRALDWTCRASAILGGVALVAITLMTLTSVIGRAVFSKPILGDFELVQLACAVCVASFLPYCQWKRGNIIVDFFTAGASAVAIERFDRLGALLVALVFALLAWRTTLGGLNAYATRSSSMMMGLPEWIVYVAMVPPFILTTVIGLYQTIFGQHSLDMTEHPTASQPLAKA